MTITKQQVQMAEKQQFQAARDPKPRVRLIAGPGTGKSHCIEERVNYLLGKAIPPSQIFVISFTRATARELKERVVRYCAAFGLAQPAQAVNVSTMHSLALRALRSANLLGAFPTDPAILDDWEQDNIFDAEFIHKGNMAKPRAKRIRRAYDAHWQTLQALNLYASPPVTQAEEQAFDAFHSSTKLVYSCLLPGEVVRACVDQMRMGNIDPAHLPGIAHLVVDEYQDLNECDQEFVQRIANAGADLWIAGDDDQSVYAFRYAAPTGIRNFTTTYPNASSHVLEYCFRSAPAVLNAARALIGRSPNRPPKVLNSLYASAQPPVQGSFHVWRFAYGVEEAKAIANSCQTLISGGMSPREILILLCNTRAQLRLIADELIMAGVPFERPRGGWTEDSEVARFVFSLLRILQDSQDYVAHRAVLGLQHGVGPGTCASIAGKVVTDNLNFRDLFYAQYPNNVFSPRENRAIQDGAAIVRQVSTWSPADTLQLRATDISALISGAFNTAGSQRGQAALQEWQAQVGSLPQGMSLEELHSYLWSDTEAAQAKVMDAVAARLGLASVATSITVSPGPSQRVRILTMHGAKGLDGRVVFIPGLEQGLIPNSKAIRAAGLYEEQRRLLYVSITRARASCILSLAMTRTGPQAFVLTNNSSANLPPSSFLSDIGIPPQPRNGPLTAAESALILADCQNL